MAVKRNVRKTLNMLLWSRRGTAEIIGSVMFLLIMLFFFTNVFLWHDRATREMDSVLSDKMNSPVSIQWDNGDLNVTNNGGVGVTLSMLWINDRTGHWYANFTENGESKFWVDAGSTVRILLNITDRDFDDGQSINWAWLEEGRIPDVHYRYYSYGGSVVFKILTTRGNSAACEYNP
jgi:hypothetical protein